MIIKTVLKIGGKIVLGYLFLNGLLWAGIGVGCWLDECELNPDTYDSKLEPSEGINVIFEKAVRGQKTFGKFLVNAAKEIKEAF